jgi:hypothetical protein
MGRWIVGVEIHVPDPGQFNVRLGNDLVGDAGNERPVVQAEVG